MRRVVELVASRESARGLHERLRELEDVVVSEDIDDDPGSPTSLDAILNPSVTGGGTARIRMLVEGNAGLVVLARELARIEQPISLVDPETLSEIVIEPGLAPGHVAALLKQF